MLTFYSNVISKIFHQLPLAEKEFLCMDRSGKSCTKAGIQKKRKRRKRRKRNFFKQHQVTYKYRQK